ncbi:RNA polymerase II C-terminal domain phosphatase-like 1 [Acorus calamus]|uniref:protein-serine/threonine phosphatase n=1 Tax=Acorus calamus TaxID=4465 RepID=A0AAV9C3R6_ACOCL|nr:RNA polymerase II C-terminal domain phosphatase-like 1 [Acorus calamus]
MFKSVVYQGDSLLGEVEIQPQNTKTDSLWKFREIRITRFSPPSERCPPLAVLHTVAAGGLLFKTESKPQQSETSPIFALHSVCFAENKTAVIPLGEEELHLVAMNSRRSFRQCSCFWGFVVSPGLYNSCLVMLNLRCLGIVFDLDETLIVANTMRSFEDRIDALQRKLGLETDPQRISGMLAEIKRFQEDKSILKQYSENDQVVESGKIISVQSEVVPPLSDSHQQIIRPLIRFQDKNIILTRINPGIRDTSVLVRLRPAWEELRSYLTARGRKRFEVYVCTMAERDYALEMWRLLDPDSNLITSRELLDRIVCVKSGSRKSLINVFQDRMCHPKMALVIDDRLKVWDDKDQPRVHVVPAFAPYYAPQAEANNAIPILRVARNVACNVRGSFFKEFDECLLPRISDIFYEDDMATLPSAPDVSNYLIAEDDASISNGNKDPLLSEGMMDAEVGRNLKDASFNTQVIPPVTNNYDPRLTATFQHAPVPIKPLGHPAFSEPSLHSSPAREEGEVPESELDPDTRRRLLILQHGQDVRDNPVNDSPVPVRPPPQILVPPVQSRGNWFPLEEEMSPRKPNRASKEFTLDSEAVGSEKYRSHHPSFFQGRENSVPSDRVLRNHQRLPKEVDSIAKFFETLGNYSDFERYIMGMTGQDGTKHFQITVHPLAWFFGEKIGEGIGKTRKEAQHRAAENSLKYLANKYLSHVSPEPSSVDGDFNKTSHTKENGFVSDSNSFGYSTFPRDDPMLIASTSEQPWFADQRFDGFKKSVSSVASLKELVEIGEQVFGKGIGSTWDEAKEQAAEEALGGIQSMLGQKRNGSPWLQNNSNKRSKPEFSRVLQRTPSSGRYYRNGPPVP